MPSVNAPSPEANARVAELVADFYNTYPFPGYDISKYDFKEDLFKHANAYARALDMQIPLDATVADLGCGTGQLACLFAAKGRRVFGGDFSAASLEAAQLLRDKLGLETLTLQPLDLLHVDDAPGTFDYVFCNGVLHHTNDPSGGFVNVMKFTHPGSYVVIGLYNRYGRLALNLQRRWVERRHGKEQGVQREFIQDMLEKAEADTWKQDTWYADQYRHPHESVHTIEELLGWYRAHDVAYVNALPAIEPFRRQDQAMRIFQPARAAGWRRTVPATMLTQLLWTWTLRKTGGYYVIVGRRAA